MRTSDDPTRVEEFEESRELYLGTLPKSSKRDITLESIMLQY